MYNTFCSAANSLSQLYTQAQNQQKLAFQAGERHGLNELDYGGDVEVPTLPASQFQNQSHSQQQNPFPLINSQTSSGVSSQGISGQGTRMVLSDQNKNSVFSNALSSPVRRSLQPFHMAQGGYCSGSNASQVINGGRRVGHLTDQVNVGFQGGGSLASPQDGELSGMNSMVVSCNIYGQAHQNRESNSYCETDSTMDMHAESPARGFYQ